MKISEAMSRDVRLLDADDSAFQAAQLLAEQKIGAVPVTQDDRIIGMVTDRDIVVRVIAARRDPRRTKLGAIASNEPKYCFDDEDCEHVARNMDELAIRRLPVMSREKRLVGIVSIEDIRPRRAA